MYKNCFVVLEGMFLLNEGAVHSEKIAFREIIIQPGKYQQLNDI